jgi:hypothetical protein
MGRQMALGESAVGGVNRLDGLARRDEAAQAEEFARALQAEANKIRLAQAQVAPPLPDHAPGLPGSSPSDPFKPPRSPLVAANDNVPPPGRFPFAGLLFGAGRIIAPHTAATAPSNEESRILAAAAARQDLQHIEPRDDMERGIVDRARAALIEHHEAVYWNASTDPFHMFHDRTASQNYVKNVVGWTETRIAEHRQATASGRADGKPDLAAGPQSTPDTTPTPATKTEQVEECQQAGKTTPPTPADIGRLVAEHSQDKMSPALTHAAAWSIVAQTQPPGTRAEIAGADVAGPDIRYVDECGATVETVQVKAIRGLDGFYNELSYELNQEPGDQSRVIAFQVDPALLKSTELPLEKWMGRYWGNRIKNAPDWQEKATQHSHREVLIVDTKGALLLRQPVFDPLKAAGK